MTFASLGLNETLLKAVAESGYTTPTPIQQKAIPAILAGQDVMAAAQTGTGKTAGFTLPMLQRLGKGRKARDREVRALVLTPTRELAMQVQDNIDSYGKYENSKSLMICGGVNINPQKRSLLEGSDILVATPGRLLDLYQQKAVRFDTLQILVLDEADRMLDMGFIRDIRKIIALLPKQRQNLMFSATFSDDIRELARGICPQAVEIDTAPRNSTVARISQQMYQTTKEQKLPLLATLISRTSEQVLVFSRTKHGANNLVKKLKHYEISAAAIHGNKSQAQRVKALGDFKANRLQVLVATDIAARGIDIDQLAMVINFDLPQVAEDYVHRIGRTGRAGASGLAVSLVAPDDNKLLKAIERLTKQKIPRQDYRESELIKPLSAERLAEIAATEQREQQARQDAERSTARSGSSRGRRSNASRRGRGRTEASATDRAQDGQAQQPAPRQAGEGGQDGGASRSRRRRGGRKPSQSAAAQSGNRREDSRQQAGAGTNGNRQQGQDERQRPRRRRSGNRNSSSEGRQGNQQAPAAAAGRTRGVWDSLKSLIMN